jgi:hypothetical protein
MAITFALPLGGVKYGLCAYWKVQTSLHPCYAVHIKTVDLMNNVTGPVSYPRSVGSSPTYSRKVTA